MKIYVLVAMFMPEDVTQNRFAAAAVFDETQPAVHCGS